MKKAIKKQLTGIAIVAAGLTTFQAPTAQASSNPLLGEIMWVGYNFCPRGWTNADGQLLPISQYSALFSLYGTTYGGDGRTTFGLPDLRGRVAIHVGNGPGLSDYREGQRGGQESVTLTTNNLPSHNHGVSTIEARIVANSDAGVTADPEGNILANGQRAANYTAVPDPIDNLTVEMAAESIKLSGPTNNTGGSQAFDKRQPYLTLRACVALQGIFPSRN